MQGSYQTIKYAAAVGIGVGIGVVATILGGNLIDKPDFKYTFQRSSPSSYSVTVNGRPYGGTSSLDRLDRSFNGVMEEDYDFIRRIMQKESGLGPDKPISKLEIEVRK